MSISIVGLGFYVPEEPIDNEQIKSWTGKDGSWTVDKTGIESRRYISSEAGVEDLAIEAAHKALEDARMQPSDLGAIICATSTASQSIPATASLVARGLEVTNDIPAFDLNAVCSGWSYATTIGKAMLESGVTDLPILIIATDAYSRIMNREDPTTTSLFGDGSAASVIAPTGGRGFSIELAEIRNHAPSADAVKTTRNLTSDETSHRQTISRPKFSMDGGAVVNAAENLLGKLVDEVLGTLGVKKEEVDHLVIHQGNVRMVENLTEVLGFDGDKVFINANMYGNTASASAPMALTDARDKERFKRGDTVLLLTIGGGISYSAMVLRCI